MKKAIVLFYLIVLGFSYLQIPWIFGYVTVGGLVLTPSAYPYLPPLSLVIVKPSDICEGFSIYLIDVKVVGFPLKLPVVHYFHDGYEFFNIKARIGETPWETIYNYFDAIISPTWALAKSDRRCVAQVIAIVPVPLVLLSFIALSIPIYYKLRRVW